MQPPAITCSHGSFAGPAPGACRPARGPRGRAVVVLVVDHELTWVAPAPTAAIGAARLSSPASLLHLHVMLTQEHAAAHGGELEACAQAEFLDAAARAVAGYLDNIPDLPLVGEPFGGDEGTD